MKREMAIQLLMIILVLILASCAVTEPEGIPAAEPSPSPSPPLSPSPIPTPAPSPEPSEDVPIVRDPYSITYDKTIAGNEFTIIENEWIRIYLPRDADIPQDIEKIVMQCIVWVEEATGLSHLTNWVERYIFISTEEELEEFFSGMDELNRLMNAPWMDNRNNEAEDIRLGVYLFEGMGGMANPTGIYAGLDYFSDSPGSYDSVGVGVIIHELAHVVFLRAMDSFGGWFYNRPLSEGHAEWATVKIAREQGFQTMLDHWLGQLTLSHIDGIEDYFTTGWAADNRENPGTFRPYQYGYVFLSYLDEMYGAETIEDIYNEIDRADYMYPSDIDCDEAWYETNTHNSKIKVEIIKKHTSEDVFNDCIEWFAVNRDRIYS
jgi:hypothetical protein